MSALLTPDLHLYSSHGPTVCRKTTPSPHLQTITTTPITTLLGIQRRQPLKAMIQHLDNIPPRILDIQTNNPTNKPHRRAHPTPTRRDNPIRQRIGVFVRHADMETTPARTRISSSTRGGKSRVDELEHLEPHAVARRHVRELDLVQGVAVDGEDGRRGRLGAPDVHDLVPDQLEPQVGSIPLCHGLGVRDRDGDVVDQAAVCLR